MDLLSPLQRGILESFPGLRDSRKFWLTGGAALGALYLHHRRSHDLDLFTAEPSVIRPAAEELSGCLRKCGAQVGTTRAYDTFVELRVQRGGELAVVAARPGLPVPPRADPYVPGPPGPFRRRSA
ncbi:MAG: nucleotidyl transferase AbiEii/AbiGii toxin family protein [Planctomycetes bacterium]|nr:nucleotidyl transferase AbiEii/AbiGii toxin family protein [Planctomycetota bacterium]